MPVPQRVFARVRYPSTQIQSTHIPISQPREQTKPVHSQCVEWSNESSLTRRNVFNLSIILGCSHQIETKLDRLIPIACHTKSYKTSIFSRFIRTRQEQKTYILSPLAINQPMSAQCSASPDQPSTTPSRHSLTQACHPKKVQIPPSQLLSR